MTLRNRFCREGHEPVVTIKAIAERCGCSPATVSKALNGAPDVSRAMTRRVRAVAGEMGYVPNAAARTLKTARTYSFGLLFRENAKIGLAHEFFSLMLDGFKRRAEELGYDISFINRRLGGQELTYAEYVQYRRFDGVAIITANYEDPLVRALAVCGVPTVTVDDQFDGCGCVLSDNAGGVRELVRYVYEMGHRRLAVLRGDNNRVSRVRWGAFRHTCRELGVTVPDEYDLQGRFHDPEGAGEATRKLMALATPPTCIFYPDDISYLGGLRAAEDMGLCVPEDLSAVGYDGIGLVQQIRPRLTTMWQNADKMGVETAEELARAVKEGGGYTPRQILIPGELIKGETVKKL